MFFRGSSPAGGGTTIAELGGMHVIGTVLLLAALTCAFFAIGEWRRSRVLRTPLRRTGDLARRRITGDVSCEGIIQRCAPAIAPFSGLPCAYYEVETIFSPRRRIVERDGESFHLDDGSGPIEVDPRAGMDVELVVSHDEVDRGVRVIERMVPMHGRLYVAGRLDRRRVLGGPLLASRHGRAVLASEAKRTVLTGIVGAFLVFPAIALLVTIPERAEACSVVDESREVCAGRIHDDFGAHASLVVTQRGAFTVSAGTARAWIAIDDAASRRLVQNAPGGATIDLAPGAYTIHVSDSTPGHARTVPGGFAYQLTVTRSQPIAWY